MVRRNPDLAPAGPRATARERLRAIGSAWGTFLLAGLALGGIYTCVFTVSEGAAVGVVTAFGLSLLRGLGMDDLKSVLSSTATASLMCYMMIFGASIFGYFLTITRTPEMMVDLINGSGLPPLGVVGCFVLFYLVLGAVFDEVAPIVLTLPFVAPIIAGLGYDLVWWGIINLLIWKPVIAAVNGYCLGGGMELALQCDLRVASSNASFALPEVKVASVPAVGGVQALIRAIPAAHAMKMAETGSTRIWPSPSGW